MKKEFAEYKKKKNIIRSGEAGLNYDVAVLFKTRNMSESELANAFRANSNRKIYVVSEDFGQVSDAYSLITSEIERITSSGDDNTLDDSDYDMFFKGAGYGYFAYGSAKSEDDDLVNSVKVMIDSKFRPDKLDNILIAFKGSIGLAKAYDAAQALAERFGAENSICSVVYDEGTENKVSISVFG